MFDNLVESSSHKDDIQRKGSFIGITALIYGVLMVAFFVAGIYWYDAKLGDGARADNARRSCASAAATKRA